MINLCCGGPHLLSCNLVKIGTSWERLQWLRFVHGETFTISVDRWLVSLPWNLASFCDAWAFRAWRLINLCLMFWWSNIFRILAELLDSASWWLTQSSVCLVQLHLIITAFDCFLKKEILLIFYSRMVFLCWEPTFQGRCKWEIIQIETSLLNT